MKITAVAEIGSNWESSTKKPVIISILNLLKLWGHYRLHKLKKIL